jgi:site-specific DNA recombinase
MEDRDGFYQGERDDTLPDRGTRNGVNGDLDGREMQFMNGVKPAVIAAAHAAAEHGLDEDLERISATTLVRNGRSERYSGKRSALIEQLNGGGDSLAALLNQLNGSIGQQTEPLRPLRVVIYLRVSTEEQARVGGEAEGFSIPYQREVCLERVRQVGGILVDEYVDAGESAKSAHRPELQRMLRDLKTKQVDYVIVHKIDRLARNRADDVAINAAIAKAGAKLISVAEPVDETPAGKLLYNVMAGVAQYFSDNNAVEVLKGMTTKAKKGGTPYRAPIGYFNKTEFIDGARVSWIIIDPERAPLVRWAFEQYALGDWSIRELVDALNEKGLRTRATRKLTSKPVTINGVHHMLRNPYYMGVVPYQGVYHEGKHEPLVSVELWLRVQDLLRAHFIGGDKHRTHNHHLKGSIFCGKCGGRMIFSRNKGRSSTYDYFFCINRQTKRTPCDMRYLPVDTIELAIESLYQRFQLSPDRAEKIRTGVLNELQTEREETAREVQRAQGRLRAAEEQEAKLLAAYYANALTLDMMKVETERLTREKNAATRAITGASRSVAELESVLDRALMIASNCAAGYLNAQTPAIRRMFNQGLFKALYISDQGDVDRFELREPFAMLMDRNLLNDLANERQANRAPVVEVDGPETPARRTRPSAVFENTFICPKTEQPDGGAVRLGSNVISLVREGGLEPPP